MGFKCLSLPAAIRVATCENRSSKRKRESETMIQQPQIHIERNAEYYDAGYNDPSHFRVIITVPGEIGQVIGMACVDSANNGYGVFSTIGGEIVDIYGSEFENEELQWAHFSFGNANARISRNDDGSYELSLDCQKHGEYEDDYLDYLDFGWRMDNALPDLFWIEPANLIRKLIAATKH
ncbi:hypothetical protein B7L88_gp113 [Rhizobium phage RHEph10]|uniref:hypothetical protein n=1 Tax=Rhizobium phage RHEph10 TaxID=1220717 RepID=UPI0002AB4118|nr:hypothetical protein B7L88_gp113 [Rhizobium phage RHEph10]AGC36175.1 hypothetical protein RHEph10_gp132 [Rhizobium phage RHEph10]